MNGHVAQVASQVDPLGKFDSSLRRLDTPAWMSAAPGRDRPAWRSRHTSTPSGGRPRYAEHKAAAASRSSSTGRSSAVSGDDDWRSASRWSAPLSSQATPAQSPASSRCPLSYFSTHSRVSMSSCGSRCPTPSAVARSAPYLGWRSLQQLDQPGPEPLTPHLRLARSLAATPTPGQKQSRAAPHLQDGASSAWLLHDSIRSVSSAIMEFCRTDHDSDAQDGRQLPVLTHSSGDGKAIRAQDRNAPPYRRGCQVVWLESSFVSTV